MVDAENALRAHWRTLADQIDGLDPDTLEQIWDQARLLLHDNGVSFNVLAIRAASTAPGG